MRTQSDVSHRFHRFIQFAWSFLDLTQREILESCGIGQSRRAALWRATSGQNTRLMLDEFRRVIQCVSVNPVLAVTGEEVWAWIATGANPPPRLRELLVSSPLYPNPRRLRDLSQKLHDWESRTAEKITWAVVPMLSALPETVARAVHRNCARSLGSHGRRLATGLNNFHRTRRSARINGRQGRSRQTHLVFTSNLRHFRDGTGPFEGLHVDDRALGIQLFAESIDTHGDQIGVIDDENVPSDLLAHFGAFQGVFIDDDCFLVKVHRDGVRRTTCTNTNPTTRAFIHSERQRVQHLRTCVTHSWKREDMKAEVLRYLPNIGG
jgi:hypothetical protein